MLEDLPRGSRIAVVRLRSLGDCVLTTPALDLLHRARPDLRIAVVVEDRFRAVFEENPALDAILAPQSRAVRSFRPRLCLNLHGGTRSALLTAFSGARWRAAYAHFRHAFLYNARIPRAQQILGEERTVHTAEHVASAMFWLGVPVSEVPRARLYARPSGGPSVAVLHPVAATAAKTWPAAHFLAVAARLRESGMIPVFIGATSDDLSVFSEFRTLRGVPLSEIKRLLAGSGLFVGNDSGPAHMAAAFGIPSIVIFGESNPAIWGPWKTPSEIVPIGASPAHLLEAAARLGVPA